MLTPDKLYPDLTPQLTARPSAPPDADPFVTKQMIHRQYHAAARLAALVVARHFFGQHRTGTVTIDTPTRTAGWTIGGPPPADIAAAGGASFTRARLSVDHEGRVFVHKGPMRLPVVTEADTVPGPHLHALARLYAIARSCEARRLMKPSGMDRLISYDPASCVLPVHTDSEVLEGARPRQTADT